MSSFPRLVEVRRNVLKKNDEVARALRERFSSAGVFVVSLVSSPGAGKTTLLERTLTRLGEAHRVAAVVGDLAMENDAARLARSRAPVRQITTGTLCHLEAAMVEDAVSAWPLNELEFLFVENVGNLVCPSSYDLGEHLRVVLLSVTEGEDKPLKYPTIFNSADVAIVTKTDLAAACEFDWRCGEQHRSRAPRDGGISGLGENRRGHGRVAAVPSGIEAPAFRYWRSSMTDALVVVALGFFLGVRHAADADHVIAVTTIVTRQKNLRMATLTGLLWGVGHSLTVVAAGAAIVLFKLTIASRVSLGLELSVAAMLLVLGALNVAALLNYRPSMWRRLRGASRHVHSHAHSHGDYVHSHPHGHGPDVHPHPPHRTPVSALDRRFGRWRLYQYARPLIVGVVHGLAGSAAVTLLVLAAVRETSWAIAYLIVFGIGTIAGMMVITVAIASAIKMASGRSETMSRRFGLAAGLAAMAFGIAFAYSVWVSSPS